MNFGFQQQQRQQQQQMMEQQRQQQRMMEEQRRRMMQAAWMEQQNAKGYPPYQTKQPWLIFRIIGWLWRTLWALVALAIIAGIIFVVIMLFSNSNL